jgi:hypothetical protein
VWDRQKKFCLATTLVTTCLLLSFPSAAIADGGLVLSDSQLWARMEEGQQTAVVTLQSDNTVDVDLFVSLLDSSGQSHEVVFFVPLGTDARDFNVTEKTSLDFDEELIEQLDEALREEARNKTNVWLSLLSPTLLISGGWMLAVYLPLLLRGYGGGAGGGGNQPEETYETDSSRVDIYGLDEDTDLEALINTTGLDPSVQETLSRLTGQRIAIVTLQTQPPLPGDDDDGWHEPTGQPGIHLAWTAALVPQSGSAVYSYPLGTGSSWAHPIGLTRIYVVAPPGMDFTTQYPRLGTDYSGYPSFLERLFYSRYPTRPRIMDHYDTPAYAIDETRGDFGHIWRATYTQSNAAEDVVISLAPSGGFLTTVRESLRGWGKAPSILLGLLIALLLWVVAWRYLMPRILGTEYRWRGSKLWRDSLIYLGINAAVALPLAMASGVFFIAFFVASSMGTAVFVAFQIVAALVFGALYGLPSILTFVRSQRRDLGVSEGRAAAAYIVVLLVANSAYLALAFVYAALAGAV